MIESERTGFPILPRHHMVRSYVVPNRGVQIHIILEAEMVLGISWRESGKRDRETMTALLIRDQIFFYLEKRV